MTAPPGQDDVVRALAEPAFYPHRPRRVEHVQTHISHVFLAAGMDPDEVGRRAVAGIQRCDLIRTFDWRVARR